MTRKLDPTLPVVCLWLDEHVFGFIAVVLTLRFLASIHTHVIWGPQLMEYMVGNPFMSECFPGFANLLTFCQE